MTLKRLADGLTAVRFVVAFPMVWLALTQPPERTLAPAVWLTIVAWTSDWLDGPLARRSRISQQTWLGRHDLEADLTIVLGLALILVSWGIALPGLVALLVAGGWMAWYAFQGRGPVTLLVQGMWIDHDRLGISTALLQLAMSVVYGSFMLVVWIREPRLGRILAGWLGVTVLLSPGRSWHRVRSFLVVTRQFLLRKRENAPRSADSIEG